MHAPSRSHRIPVVGQDGALPAADQRPRRAAAAAARRRRTSASPGCPTSGSTASPRSSIRASTCRRRSSSPISPASPARRRARRRCSTSRRSATPTRCSTSCGCSAIRRCRTRPASVDPARDVRTMEDEVILADLGVVERRLERLERDLKKGNTPELRKEQDILHALPRPRSRDGQPLRALDSRRDDAKRLRGFQFLSAKPLLLVLNLDEADLPQADDAVRLAGLEVVHGRRSDPRGADLREDRARDRAAGPADAAAFMADLGLRESGLDRVIRASYDLLGYISFFTVGEDECRAWSIPRDTPAVLAAGEIHSDISRGFIRAEVVGYEQLLSRGIARRLPRSRRAAPRRQGIHRARRRRDQLPPRHVAIRVQFSEQSVHADDQTCVVCEAQVPFVHGGAEVHVRELVRELRARGYHAELVSVPFKWYPKEEILPHAAAWRLLDLSESNGRPIDLRHRLEVPDLLRAPPEQGRLADPSVPRRLRAVRHAVQRLRPQRSGRRPARHADPARHRDARRMPARSSPTRGTPRRVWRSSTASRPSRCIIRRGWPRASRRARTATTCSRSAGSNRSSASTCIVRALALVDRPLRLIVAGDGTQRAERRARADAGRRRRSRHLSRQPSTTTQLIELYAGALAVVYPPLRRGLRLRHARGVPRAQAGRHLHRLRRPERVRRRRRQRLRLRAGRPRRSPTRSTRSPADRAPRRRDGRRRLRGRAPDHLGRRHREAGRADC